MQGFLPFLLQYPELFPVVRQRNEIEEAKKVQKVNRERKADHDSAKQTLLAWLGSIGLTPEQLAEHERQINGEGGAIWDPRSV